MVRIVADHVHAVKALANHVRAVKALTAASADSLDHATLSSSYEHAINLARVLYSSENLTNRFAVLVTENKDLALERDPATADCNMLTAWVTQLQAQLMQTLTLTTATTNTSPTGHKGQTDPEKFTREDRGKLRSLVAVTAWTKWLYRWHLCMLIPLFMHAG
jgi:hypothetical protein